MPDLFAAVGDETRRWILERLRSEGPLSVSSLTLPLPISRQAVTKHLNVLEAAGLVERRVRGRERLHALTAAPLRALSDWLAPYEAEWDERLARLSAHVDGDKPERGDDGD